MSGAGRCNDNVSRKRSTEILAPTGNFSSRLKMVSLENTFPAVFGKKCVSEINIASMLKGD
jgi:hypothetical protein